MKQELVILHGALGAASQFNALIDALGEEYQCYTLDFSGHGQAKPSSQLTIESCVKDVERLLDESGLVRPAVFGYSMGGYVALTLEGTQPGTFSKIMTLGTKFDWTIEGAEREIAMLNPVKIEEKVPKFAAYLDSIHEAQSWKDLMVQTHGLMRKLGNQPVLKPEVLTHVSVPVVLARGGEDVMVSQEETVAIQNHLPFSFFETLEDVPHPIQQVPLEPLVDYIRRSMQF